MSSNKTVTIALEIQILTKQSVQHKAELFFRSSLCVSKKSRKVSCTCYQHCKHLILYIAEAAVCMWAVWEPLSSFGTELISISWQKWQHEKSIEMISDRLMDGFIFCKRSSEQTRGDFCFSTEIFSWYASRSGLF